MLADFRGPETIIILSFNHRVVLAHAGFAFLSGTD